MMSSNKTNKIYCPHVQCILELIEAHVCLGVDTKEQNANKMLSLTYSHTVDSRYLDFGYLE